MKPYSIISTILLPILAILYGYQWYSHAQDLDRAAEAYAMRDSLYVLSETSRAKLAREVDTRDALLSGQTAELRDALDRLRLKPKVVTRTVIEARPETLTTVLRDTIVMREGVRVVSWPFSLSQGRYHVAGSVYPDTHRLQMRISQDPISLSVILSETKAGNFVAAVDVPDSTLRVGDIETRVIPRRPGWFSRNRWWLGFGVGAVSMAMVLR